MSTALFLETLKRAELGLALIHYCHTIFSLFGAEKYYGNLTNFGVQTLDSLTQLTMQDYGLIGLHSMEDRKSKRYIEFFCINF